MGSARWQLHLLLAVCELLWSSAGFAQANRFSLKADDPNMGNSVTLVSRTRSIPCDVEKDTSHSKQITALPEDDYEIHVSVDGVPITQMCNWWNCRFYMKSKHTPHNLALKMMNDKINCNYLSFLRHGLKLDSGGGEWGYMSCKMTGTYVEVTGVSPSEGSVLGGTSLTIHGRYFDETDRPAVVLVGGGRGLKMEMWNNSNPSNLDDVLTYNSSRPGYSVQWLDSLSYVWPTVTINFVARLSGFFVPTETDNYYFRIRADGRSMVYFSKTGLPKDKNSEVMRLEKGKPYYIEVVVQKLSYQASVDVAFFKEISPFTAQQTTEAVDERQRISTSYNVLPEKQGWTRLSAVQEMQTLRISSDCFTMGFCDNTFFILAYGDHTTGPIPVSASALDLQNTLNDLWTISPDTVIVTKEELSTEALYNVTFNSNREAKNRTEDLLIQSQDNATVTITRPQKATPPLTGTFDVEIFGRRVEGLPVDISAGDLQYALQGIPELGSSGLATVVNITGSGFGGGNVTVKTGDVDCYALNVTDTYITCRVGPASAGIYPVSLSFSGLGIARYQNGTSFNFTHLLGVTSIYPTTGSEAALHPDFQHDIFGFTGGAILTVLGYGLSIDTAVTIGTQPCNVTGAELTQLRCIVPAGSTGEQTVTVTTGEMTATSNESFTYDNTLMATITSVSPTLQQAQHSHNLRHKFEEQINGSSVLVGETECELLQWNNENITCMLPKLTPAVYDIRVRVGNQGYALTSAGVNTTIEFVLKVTGFSPPMGSLYGGTTITISGSGFSSITSENNVTLGFFSYRFTSPGVYYYSSGFIDSSNQKTLQGVVTVRPLEERPVGLQVSVAGIQASVNLASRQMSSSESACLATFNCVRNQLVFNDSSDGLFFTLLLCQSNCG
ncbi:Fibrocystin-L Polycystic kidney and hepatic disease 1-like protein 1 [Triplophysa tibetana]|uniref:Fibrocystin-L Polycystic kidney and hepatic disease 1-like protein 1 n=1 Tax=Triplophysa tibetana TaxID=1572043 RepID=A0A5A9NL98_9TELE|nr:Fibrocystin-L Polycystic kidney and hepatic disease 1-like protein 1 [Triplophysa tibetana]